ncbi:MAG: ATP-binding protein [Chloroflexi bacterium RBG_16_54_11]|nr:MAG: ATP-binding protein [Chloroflexi bacterium RBG_16_54_11]
MKVLLIGVGGVGEAIAKVGHNRPWLEKMVLADYDLARARLVQEQLGSVEKFPIERIDARDIGQVVRLARLHDVDLIMNAVSNFYNDSVFDAAYEGGCDYLDMAMSDDGANMGSHQWRQAEKWEGKGRLAILGNGMDPGVSDIFAKYASVELFDEVDEIGIRDGAALEVRGYEFAPSFSILDAIEECTNSPIVWEKGRGWFEVPLFGNIETFDFPEGIGPQEVVDIEHEEVVLIPRFVPCKRVTFKYGLGEKFINVIKVIKLLGLHRKEAVDIKGAKVAPIEMLAAVLPSPASLGDKMTGKTCVGAWVTGVKDSKRRAVYIYQSTDNQESMQRYGCQAVSLQTATGPVITMELLAQGIWKGKGVLGPEAFDPRPFLARMPEYDFPFSIREEESEYSRSN